MKTYTVTYKNYYGIEIGENKVNAENVDDAYELAQRCKELTWPERDDVYITVVKQ